MAKAIADLDTPTGVLGFARDRRRIADAAEVDLLQAALAWADLHPVESVEQAATHVLRGFGDTGLLLGGTGARWSPSSAWPSSPPPSAWAPSPANT